MSKIKSFTGGHAREVGKKAATVTKEGQEASFIPSPVRKILVFLTQSYGSKIAKRKFHSVSSEIRKGN